MPVNRPDSIKATFTKIAQGEIQPNNFGSALTHAIRDGFLQKDKVARLLDVKPDKIRKTGNSLNEREIRKIAQALLNFEPKN